MPWESIGSCGTGSVVQLRMAILYLCQVCGEPPLGCELDVLWNEHDLGDYPTIGVSWDPTVRSDAPWKYINRCEAALAIFDEAVEWSEIHPDQVREKLEAKEEGNSHLAQKPHAAKTRKPVT